MTINHYFIFSIYIIESTPKSQKIKNATKTVRYKGTQSIDYMLFTLNEALILRELVAGKDFSKWAHHSNFKIDRDIKIKNNHTNGNLNL